MKAFEWDNAHRHNLLQDLKGVPALSIPLYIENIMLITYAVNTTECFFYICSA